VRLQEEGFDVVIIDNLSNSDIKVLDGIVAITGITPAFEQLDLREKSAVSNFFNTYDDIGGVIHFAASKAVGESVENPLLYYENNIGTLVYLLQELQKKEQASFIFSSSCTVYGQADQMPITEMAAIKKAESPYGNTKQIGEEIIQDTCRVCPNIKATALRYFNPIGAHQSALIGELPIGVPQNLVPYITQEATGQRAQLSVFGDDYPTPDGTCIRDYIHVMDLAQAHIDSIYYLISSSQKLTCEIFNVGTGQGVSVLEVIKEFENTTSKSVPYKLSDPRKGDTVAAYADVKKINNQLGWKPKFSLKEALQSALNWEKELDKKS
jgi:UDP-glucose 4-epimerase